MKLTRGKKIALTAFGLFLAFMAVCTVVAKGIYAAGLPRVSTTKPYSGSITHVIEANASVKQGQEYGVYVEAGLRVDTVSVGKGAFFKVGDALLRIETGDLAELIAQRRLEIAKLEVQKAEAIKAGSHDRNEQQTGVTRAKEDYNKVIETADVRIAVCQQQLESAQRELALYDQYLKDSAEAAEKAEADNPGGNGNGNGEQPPADNGNGNMEQPPADNGNTEKPPADNGNGNGEKPPADNGNGNTEQSPTDNGNGDAEQVPVDNGNGNVEQPPVDNGNGDAEQVPVDNGNGNVEQLPADNGSGNKEQLSPDNINGNAEQSPADLGNGDTGQIPADTGNGDTSQMPVDNGNTNASQSSGENGGGMLSGSIGTNSNTRNLAETGSGDNADNVERESSSDTYGEAVTEIGSSEAHPGISKLWEVIYEVVDYEQHYTQQEKRLQLEQQIIACTQALEEAKRQKEADLLAATRLIEDAESAVMSDVSTVNLLALEVEYQKERLARLEELLEADGWVYAKASGRVVDCSLAAGERVPDGAGILYALDDGEQVMNAVFTKEQSKYISVGTQFEAKVTMPDGSRASGTALVENQEEGENGSSYAKLSFEGLELEIGQSAQLSYKQQTDTYSTCISRMCLYQESENTYYIFVAEEREGILGTEWKVKKVNVTVLDQNDTVAAIQSVEVSSETRVVISTTETLTDGATVRVLQ